MSSTMSQTMGPTKSGATRVQIRLGSAQVILDSAADTQLAMARWKLHQALTHDRVQVLLATVIVLNCITVGLELELGTSAGTTGFVLDVIENTFLSIYLAELAARFFAYGLRCWHCHWVKFDLVVVSGGVLERVVLPPLHAQADGLGMLLVLRVFRLFRLARTFKLLVRFREMAVLVKGLLTSLSMMLYTLILLLIMLFMFACAGKELIGSLATDSELDGSVTELADYHFSSVSASMLTLVQFVCLDSVAAIFTPIVKARPWLAAYFMSTILVIGIVLMNLVTAVMVNSAIEKAEEDKDLVRQVAKEKQAKLAKELEHMFQMFDVDGSNQVSRDEFMVVSLESQHVSTLRECLPDMDLEDIFDALDVDSSGSVDMAEFLEGVADLVKSGMTPQMKRLATQVENIHKQVSDILECQLMLCQHLGLSSPILAVAASRRTTCRGTATQSSSTAGLRIGDSRMSAAAAPEQQPTRPARMPSVWSTAISENEPVMQLGGSTPVVQPGHTDRLLQLDVAHLRTSMEEISQILRSQNNCYSSTSCEESRHEGESSQDEARARGSPRTLDCVTNQPFEHISDDDVVPASS